MVSGNAESSCSSWIISNCPIPSLKSPIFLANGYQQLQPYLLSLEREFLFPIIQHNSQDCLSLTSQGHPEPITAAGGTEVIDWLRPVHSPTPGT